MQLRDVELEAGIAQLLLCADFGGWSVAWPEVPAACLSDLGQVHGTFTNLNHVRLSSGPHCGACPIEALRLLLLTCAALNRVFEQGGIDSDNADSRCLLLYAAFLVNFLGIEVAEAVTHQVRDVDGGLRLAEESLPLLVSGARRERRERLGWLSNVSLLFGHVFDLLRGLNHCVERHVALQGHQVLARAVDRLE